MQGELGGSCRLASAGGADECDDVWTEAAASTRGLLEHRCCGRELRAKALDVGGARGDDFDALTTRLAAQMAPNDDCIFAKCLTSFIEDSAEVGSVERFESHSRY